MAAAFSECYGRLCVSHPVSKGHLFIKEAGGSSPLMSLLPTQLLMSWEDIGADHSDILATTLVPAVLSVDKAVTLLFG